MLWLSAAYSFASSTVGKYVIIAALAVAAIGVLVHEVRKDAVNSATTEAVSDAAKRLENAISNSDSVSADPNKLRQPDPHCRDC